jgi:hypothetical protein
MSGGPEIALNRGPLVTCLCQHVGEDIEVWSIGSDRASSDRGNIDVPFPVLLLGTDKKSIKCYAQLGDDFTRAISLIWRKFAVKGAGLLRGTMNNAEYPASTLIRPCPTPARAAADPRR